MTENTNELGDFAETEPDEPTDDQYGTPARYPEPLDPLGEDFDIGDPVIDLANGRNMVVVDRADDRADDWTEANGYDLLDNYGNRRLRAKPSDPVYTCVYVASLGSNPSKTYDFPSSRLGRAEYENPLEGRKVYDLVALDVLDRMFQAAFETDGDQEWGGIPPVDVLESLARLADLDDDVVDEAYELADVEQTIATDGGDLEVVDAGDLEGGDRVEVAYESTRSKTDQHVAGVVTVVGTVEGEYAPTGTPRIVIDLDNDDRDLVLWPAWDEVRSISYQTFESGKEQSIGNLVRVAREVDDVEGDSNAHAERVAAQLAMADREGEDA
jgi:hypothetical protein